MDAISSGCKINFTDTPVQTKLPHPIKFNEIEQKALDDIILQLEKDKVIERCEREPGDYVNQVFLREKKSTEGKKYRIILNMKKLNKDFIESIKHKSTSLQSCLDLMEPNCYMGSIDLANAFHTVPMHPDFTKYLKFTVKNITYKYLVLPMGYKDSARMFLKILKPVLAHLRAKSFLSSVYTDDFFLTDKTPPSCSLNVETTKQILKKLGFDFSDKSVTQPTQNLLHLGFILNSVSMTVSLGSDKKSHIRNLVLECLNGECFSIRFLARLIGTLVAAFPGVEYGKLYYRQLEMLKTSELRRLRNYEAVISLTQPCREELQWWLQEGLDSHKDISHGNPDLILTSDSSDYGWGAHLSHNKLSTQGLWSSVEAQFHINVKELKAVVLGVEALCSNVHSCHLQIQSDNTTTVSYINNMGGTHSLVCNHLAKQLILFCKLKHIWVSACHVAGSDNILADKLSRDFNHNIEWSLHPDTFQELCSAFGTPDIDLFASRINHKLPTYVSLNPDAKAIAIDAFAHKWESFMYIFPPFNLIPRILRKLKEDKTKRVVMVTPNWSVAQWFPVCKRMALQNPILLRNRVNILQLPTKPKEIHPLLPKMRLLGWFLSGEK